MSPMPKQELENRTRAEPFVQRLLDARRAYTYPQDFRRWAEEFIDHALGFLFPHFAADNVASSNAIERELEKLNDCLANALASLANVENAVKVSHDFVEVL